MAYEDFLAGKTHLAGDFGFEPTWEPPALFDFQRGLLEWALRKGRCAIFADCGLGKTPIQLAWAENVARHTDKPVLILAPLAVAPQTIDEGVKFGVECHRSHAGEIPGRVVVANYERLHYFNPSDFAGVVCDESSILKNFDGVRKAQVTEFCRTMPYRLLCTATAAPNDYIELGTSAEALGVMGFTDMLGHFFKNDTNPTCDTRRRYAAKGGEVPKWRFKHHAQGDFWRWVCSWARACRKPSDLGFEDGAFILPRLTERETVVEKEVWGSGSLFPMVASCLKEEREEARATIRERCEVAAERAMSTDCAVVWCHLNEEGDLLEKLIPGSVQVKGAQSDEAKEERFVAFASRSAKVLITKPKIGAFGLNWQHCAQMTFFPSHSYEQYYQAVRRCWRFGQKREVAVDIITTEGGARALHNLQRKSAAADAMFSQLVDYMNEAKSIKKVNEYTREEEVPSWL